MTVSTSTGLTSAGKLGLTGVGLLAAAAIVPAVTTVVRPAAAVDRPRPVAAVPAGISALPTVPPAVPPTGGAASSVPDDAAMRPRFGWPLAPRPAVIHPFAPGPYPWSAGHRGVDLAAGAGATVRAAAAGRVTFAGPVAGRGVLVIAHRGGVRTTYQPVTATVPVGAELTAGQPVGRLAAVGAHCMPGCLHWGALAGNESLDPLLLIAGRRRPPVLLPLAVGGPAVAPRPISSRPVPGSPTRGRR